MAEFGNSFYEVVLTKDELRRCKIEKEELKVTTGEKTLGGYAFPMSALSGGTARFVALAVLLIQPCPPKLILIDEPEPGLHPFAVAALADLIKFAGQKSQLIVSTQSIQLLNAFDPETEDTEGSNILIVENPQWCYICNADNAGNTRRLDRRIQYRRVVADEHSREKSVTLILKIHVEGFTEASFASHILRPYLEEKGCSISVVINKTSNAHGVTHRGGLSNYEQFRINTRRLLKNKNSVVTTMIDYYGLPSDFPGMGKIYDYSNAYEQVRYLERMLDQNISGEDIADDNFTPYIQLHEFEALLFSDITVIDKVLSIGRSSHYEELAEIRRNYEPEEINTSPESAPSKRLYPRYSKNVEGILNAEKNRSCKHPQTLPAL